LATSSLPARQVVKHTFTARCLVHEFGKLTHSRSLRTTSKYLRGLPRTCHSKVASEVRIRFGEAVEATAGKPVNKGVHRFLNVNSWPGRIWSELFPSQRPQKT
jgi:hypothetical protein